MTYEIERHTKKGEIQVKECNSEEQAFKQALEGLNELTFGDTGNDTYRIELEDSGLEDLLYQLIEELRFLQDSRDLQIGKVKSLEIEKDQSSLHQKLEVEMFMDKQTGRKYWPVRKTVQESVYVDYERGMGWKTGLKVCFDLDGRKSPQTEPDF